MVQGREFSSDGEVKNLVELLESATKVAKRGKATKVQCRSFQSGLKINSWKFNEWDYGKNNVGLPCEARGLFILDDAENPEIIARGYDKFFNVNEIFKNTWPELSKNTVGPYEVTLKENGCIIFISSRDGEEIIVCSKHSTGPREDTDRNHAEAGEIFLRKQLESKGVDVGFFAKKLAEMNCTAVAEYCDDLFEEHILEYCKDARGLYLHGLNLNSRRFQTLSMGEVERFARQYGFKVVEHFIKEDIGQLKEFLEECSERGHYNDAKVEGFVIRCKTVQGDHYFFKYKFEEPYLLYRQWREVTKDYINSKLRVYNFKKHRFITNKYLDFVIPLLDADPKLAAEYLQGVGTIKLRKMFLEDYGLSSSDLSNGEAFKKLEIADVDENTRFMFFPVATVGCGKTTIALTLKNLFGNSWEHVQNDDIKSKDKSKLMKESLSKLSQDGVKAVIVDKNNHKFKERKDLFEWLIRYKENYLPYDCSIKVIGLSFSSGWSDDTTRDILAKRVLSRGDNHQSIKATFNGSNKTLSILDGFINRFQPINDMKFPDNLFDFIIELNVDDHDSSLKNVNYIIEMLHSKYPVLVSQKPSKEKLYQSFNIALNYKPTITKIIDNKEKRSQKFKPIYFSAHISDSKALIERINDLIKRKHPDFKEGLYSIIDEAKVKREFHITLHHISASKHGTSADKEMWRKYEKRYRNFLLKPKDSFKEPPASISTLDFVEYKLESILFDEFIIALKISLDVECIRDAERNKVKGLKCSNKFPHITIGILKDVKPAYSNRLCELVYEIYPQKELQLAHGIYCFDFESEEILEAKVHVNL